MKISNYHDLPSSIYRLQLSKDFPLRQAIKILPYLKDLGIGGVYCSPFYDAYSSHGYDVTDPNKINPQLGTPEDYEEFCALLKQLGLKQIIDLIPNHMGIKGGKNIWWQDILENGPYSEYALFFDINWSPEKKELQDRVLLPILGENYGAVLENQDIKLSYADGVFKLSYMDFPLPVRPQSYALILETQSESLKSALGAKSEMWKEYEALIELYRFFPVVIQERNQKNQEGKKKLAELSKNSKEVRRHLSYVVSLYNGKKKQPHSFDHLDKLLEAQFYRLAYWKVASHEINYRRFFNIHELVAIRIEEESVLEQHHRWIFELMDSGKVQGLRIDHPDGLYDPVGYFARLRKKVPMITFVEKILDRKEELPETWQVEGTVGYEYLNLLNGIFIRKDNEKKFTEIYEQFLGKKVDFEEILYRSKKLFSTQEMVSEVEALGLKLDRLSEHSRYFRDFTRHDLTEALAEVIACFPVYRTYVDPQAKITKRDAHYIKIAIEKAKTRASDLDVSIFEFLEKILLIKLKEQEELKAGYLEFVLRFQQLTGPMMAKGLEDTSFYIYNRFISLNEVGGDPIHFGHSVGEFHKFNQNKKEKWPFGFLASSTHDTKRSEDARQRLNVLSEIPEIWQTEIKKWSMVTQKFKDLGPTPNVEYMIYQTLLAIWPRKPLPRKEHSAFAERVWQIILKSLREGKEETSWFLPNEVYEEAVRNFVLSILSPEKENLFLKMFLPFQKKIDQYGALNSFSATVLKIASCGIVDVYQGNETLIYRLVDPDNRSPVNFQHGKKILESVKKIPVDELLCSKDYDKIKLYLHWKALHFRKSQNALFLAGDYLPLKVKGGKKDHVVAFMRKFEHEILIVLAGRFFASLDHMLNESFGGKIWLDTEVFLPKEMQDKVLLELFSENEVKVKKYGQNVILSVAEVFRYLPFGYLFLKK